MNYLNEKLFNFFSTSKILKIIIIFTLFININCSDDGMILIFEDPMFRLPSYNIIYDANGGSGTLPSDTNDYLDGDPVTVLNHGTLSNGVSFFLCWNTQADGNGTDMAEGSTFNIGTADVTLYAKWVSEIVLSYETWDDATEPAGWDVSGWDLYYGSAGTDYIDPCISTHTHLALGSHDGSVMLLFRSYGCPTLVNSLPLTTGGFTKLRFDFDYTTNFISSASATLQYSASGDFTDTVNIKQFAGSSDGSGGTYQINTWYTNEIVEVTDGQNGIVFTDTAKIRWVSGGPAANFRRNWIDNIIITGLFN